MNSGGRRLPWALCHLFLPRKTCSAACPGENCSTYLIMSSVPQFGSQFSGGLSTRPEPRTAGLTPAPQVPPMSQVPVAVCRVSSAVLGLPEELRKPVLCLNRSSLHCHCPLSLQLGLGWEGSLSSGQIRRPSCHPVPCLPATSPTRAPSLAGPPQRQGLCQLCWRVPGSGASFGHSVYSSPPPPVASAFGPELGRPLLVVCVWRIRVCSALSPGCAV